MFETWHSGAKYYIRPFGKCENGFIYSYIFHIYNIRYIFMIYKKQFLRFLHLVLPFYRTYLTYRTYRTYRTQCGRKLLFISSAMIRHRERGRRLDLGNILGIDPLHKVSFLHFLHLLHHAPN